MIPHLISTSYTTKRKPLTLRAIDSVSPGDSHKKTGKKAALI